MNETDEWEDGEVRVVALTADDIGTTVLTVCQTDIGCVIVDWPVEYQ